MWVLLVGGRCWWCYGGGVVVCVGASCCSWVVGFAKPFGIGIVSANAAAFLDAVADVVTVYLFALQWLGFAVGCWFSNGFGARVTFSGLDGRTRVALYVSSK